MKEKNSDADPHPRDGSEDLKKEWAEDGENSEVQVPDVTVDPLRLHLLRKADFIDLCKYHQSAWMEAHTTPFLHVLTDTVAADAAVQVAIQKTKRVAQLRSEQVAARITAFVSVPAPFTPSSFNRIR